MVYRVNNYALSYKNSEIRGTRCRTIRSTKLQNRGTTAVFTGFEVETQNLLGIYNRSANRNLVDPVLSYGKPNSRRLRCDDGSLRCDLDFGFDDVLVPVAL